MHQFHEKSPQNRSTKSKKTMIWTLATMLKCLCFAFLKNYVQHINDIHETLFQYFEHERIQKYIYRAPVPWTTTLK